MSVAKNVCAAALKVAFLGVMSSGSTALAQVRSMPPDPYDSHQNVPTANSPAAPSGSSSGKAATTVTDFPAAEVREVPVAMAQAAHSRAVFDLAQTNIRLVVDRLKEDFEFSGQVLTAMRGQKLAYERYTAARDRVLGKLASESQYQTLASLRDDLGEKLDGLHAQPIANRQRIDATAAVKMQYATKISQMESDALKADSAVQDAKAQYVDASNHLADMRSEFQRSIRRDSTFVAARNELEEAKIDRDSSLAFLAGAVEARDIAMDYAYSLHQWDRFRYLSAGGYGIGYPYDNGYGYGVSYGYNVPSLVYNPIDYYHHGPYR